MRLKQLVPLTLILILLGGCAGKSNIDPSATITDMRRYSEGFAAIELNGKWGYIDQKGFVAIEPQFSEADPFSDGLAAVRLNEMWGIIDTKGKYLLIPTHEGLGQYSEGLMPYLDNGKWGFIAPPHKLAIPAQFDEVGPFHEGFAAARIDNHWGYIDKKGHFVINPRFTYAGNFSCGMAPVSETNNNGSYGYINTKGTYVITPQFDGVESFSEKLAAIYDDGKWGYIDRKGKLVINLKYDCAEMFANGLAAVRMDGKWGYINDDGKPVIANQFKAAFPFLDEYALVLDPTGQAYHIDMKGTQVLGITGTMVEPVQPDFPYFTYFQYFPYTVKDAEKIGMKRLPQHAADFCEIKPVRYFFKDSKNKLTFRTTEARIFYSFHAADSNPTDAPLFVMLNGGPGAATVTNLFSFNTAPYTLDRERQEPGSPGYSRNPYSWTQLGNVLYIDASATGFSYLVSKDSKEIPRRMFQFFGFGNFNPYIDAAQIVRVILRFLEDYPEIRGNKVVLVGESYGGTRVSAMLNLLLFNQDYTDGSKLYADPDMVDEIQAHFRKLYPDEPATPEVVARQFGRQVLIQPQLTGKIQDDISAKMFFNKDGYKDTVMADLAKDSHYKGEFNKAPYPDSSFCAEGSRETADCAIMGWLPQAFHRDRYNTRKTTTWSDDLEAYTLITLRDPEALSTVLGQDIRTIPLMKASAREDAFKLITGIKTDYGYTVKRDQPDEGDLPGGKWYLSPDAAQFLPKEQSRLDRLAAMDQTQARIHKKAQEESGIAAVEGKLEEWLGELHYYDGYMIEMNVPAFSAYGMINTLENQAFDVDPGKSLRYGRMFLENLSLVNTFLTDCQHDMVIYSPAIPECLKEYPVVKKVNYKRGKDKGGANGTFEIEYVENGLAPYKTPTSPVRLYYPYYEKAGHSVSSEQPDKFLDDMKKWMKQ